MLILKNSRSLISFFSIITIITLIPFFAQSQTISISELIKINSFNDVSALNEYLLVKDFCYENTRDQGAMTVHFYRKCDTNSSDEMIGFVVRKQINYNQLLYITGSKIVYKNILLQIKSKNFKGEEVKMDNNNKHELFKNTMTTTYVSKDYPNNTILSVVKSEQSENYTKINSYVFQLIKH